MGIRRVIDPAECQGRRIEAVPAHAGRSSGSPAIDFTGSGRALYLSDFDQHAEIAF